MPRPNVVSGLAQPRRTAGTLISFHEPNIHHLSVVVSLCACLADVSISLLAVSLLAGSALQSFAVHPTFSSGSAIDIPIPFPRLCVLLSLCADSQASRTSAQPNKNHSSCPFRLPFLFLILRYFSALFTYLLPQALKPHFKHTKQGRDSHLQPHKHLTTPVPFKGTNSDPSTTSSLAASETRQALSREKAKRPSPTCVIFPGITASLRASGFAPSTLDDFDTWERVNSSSKHAKNYQVTLLPGASIPVDSIPTKPSTASSGLRSAQHHQRQRQ